MRFFDKIKEEFSFIKGNYLILVLSWILIDFAMELPGSYYSKYVEALGATESIVGAIGAVAFISAALVQFPGGYLADSYGRKWLISTLTFGVALSYIFFAVAPTWHYIFLGTMIGSLCLIYQPAMLAMMADSMPPQRRGMGYSIINLIMSVSTTPAPAVAVLLVATYDIKMGMRIGYVIVIVLFVAAAFLRLRLKESLKDPKKISIREMLRAYPQSLKEGINVWKNVPESTLFLFLADLLLRFSSAMIQFNLIFYAMDVLGLNKVDWGLVMFSLFAVMIILAVPVGMLVDKIGRKIPLMMTSLLIIPSMTLFVWGDLPRIFIGLSLFGLVILLLNTGYQSLLADLVPREQRGKIIGSSNFVSYIFMALGSLAGGILYEKVSPQLPFLFILGSAIPHFIIITFKVHEPKKREE